MEEQRWSGELQEVHSYKASALAQTLWSFSQAKAFRAQSSKACLSWDEGSGCLIQLDTCTGEIQWLLLL